ncbi:hypothetical protein [Xanthomonas campestris]|uniref:hypothetical protein n=1 Tax=Xanthomonas campestris TaxID=339 RepID=UPI002368CA93|nr:hypothetical protein [Xanthomonas campestris]WDI91921.1 hypothetical protein JH280_11285 [Xanthomonas campestris]
MANALSDFLGGFEAGDQITSNQREQRQTNQLARLASQVIGGDPQAYAQAAAINPQAAQQYQQSGDQIAKRARGAAKFLQSALQSGNQQQIMAARQTIKPFMDTLKPGSSYPLDMDPMQEMAGIEGFLTQTSYLDGGLKPSENKVVGNALVTPDGREVYRAPVNGQLVEVPDGKSGKMQMLFDPQTRQFTRPDYGQDAAPALQTINGAAGPYRVGSDLTPAELELAAADAAGGGDLNNVQLPQRDVPPQQFASGGGGMGYTPPKPEISAAEAVRLQLAQEASQRAAAAERRAKDAADRAARGTPPAGYRWNAAGTDVEPIPGAPQTTAVGSEDERKAAGWYGQATRALANMRAAVDDDAGADTPGIVETYSPIKELANRTRSPARQRYENASSSLAEALLRAATGAGVNESEARQKIAEVTPQRGDSQALKDQKIAAAEGYLSDLQARAGRALRPGQAAAPAPQQFPNAPRVGSSMDGYIYVGGDPASQASWRKQ